MAKRVALYLRVSTGDGQTIENQRQALEEMVARAGWQVVEVYADEESVAPKAASGAPLSTACSRRHCGANSI
jgi:DNA invertase Pin-like site-specific DNA recombinase